MTASWTSRQWAALVGVLVFVIFVLVTMWPRQAAPRSIVVEIVDGPKVLATQIVTLSH